MFDITPSCVVPFDDSHETLWIRDEYGTVWGCVCALSKAKLYSVAGERTEVEMTPRGGCCPGLR